MLTTIRTNLVDTESSNSSNMCSATSAINLKSLDEHDADTFLINPMGLRGNLHGGRITIRSCRTHIALSRPNADESVSEDMNKSNLRLG